MKRVIQLLIILLTCVLGMNSFFSLSIAQSEQNIDYTESTDGIVNPETGFYKALSAELAKSDSNALFTLSRISDYAEEYSILHLRIGLKAFSSKAGGTDGAITTDAINSLKNTFDLLRQVKVGAIIRFSYNVSGDTVDGEYIEAEPSLNLILSHVRALGGVISDYKDVILGVESGMFGPWGEQHSTEISDSSNADNYHALVDAWLESTPESMGITVRRPLYAIHWLNVEYGLSFTTKNIKNFDKSLYPLASRVGVFNDGYLGSSSDLGTFSNRSNEVDFISKLSTTTFYGGEVVADSKTGGIGNYNNCSYLESEAFTTHTTYLNIEWNYEKVISVWQANEYNGNDELYHGLTEFDYVNNHLGYRLVLTDSKIAVENGMIKGQFTLKNVGFANVIREMKASLNFVNSDSKVSQTIDFDVRNVASKQSSTYEFTLGVSDSFSEGEWDCYLQIQSATGKNVRFANKSEYFTEDGNYIGAISVKQEEVGSVAISDITTKANATVTKSDTGAQTVSYDQSPGWHTFDFDVVGFNQQSDNNVLQLVIEASDDFTVCFAIGEDEKIDWSVGHKLYSGGKTVTIKLDLSADGKYGDLPSNFTVLMYLDSQNTVNSTKTIEFKSISVVEPSISVEDVELKDGEVFIGWSYDGKLYSSDYDTSLFDESVTAVTLNFNMVAGASVRISNPSGLRFITLLDTACYENIIELVGAENVVLGTRILRYNTDKTYMLDVVVGEGMTFAYNETLTGYTGVVVGISEENYNVEYEGRGYIEIIFADKTESVRIYANGNDNKRTVSEVARSCYESGDLTDYEKIILEQYFNN